MEPLITNDISDPRYYDYDNWNPPCPPIEEIMAGSRTARVHCGEEVFEMTPEGLRVGVD